MVDSTLTWNIHIDKILKQYLEQQVYYIKLDPL